uniref:Tc1-like transposase DDE domain-containing protein n=1 Tax=Caenorhabditis japonica TaxID=281687 RepID=A0A8R1DRV6_CAEJA
MANLSNDDFKKIGTNKDVSNCGLEIFAQIRENLEILKKILGPDSPYTIFNGVNRATAMLTGFHRSTVARHVSGTIRRPNDDKLLVKLNKTEKARHITSKLSIPQRALLMKRIHEIWREKKGETGYCKTTRRVLNKKKELDDENAFFAAFDETWVHDGMAPTSGWQHQNTTMYKKARMVDVESAQSGPDKGKERGKRGIVLAVLTEDGVLKGSEKILVDGDDEKNQKADYHGVMNSAQFKEHMLKCIPLFAHLAASKGRKGVFIIDNAPYHNDTREKPPTQSNSKQEIRDWLQKNGVPFSMTEKKKDLWTIAQEFVRRNGGRKAFTVYELDAWADEVEGVTILRLPPYHCFWNPIEFLWARMKKEIRGMGTITDSLPTVRDRALSILREFTSTDAAALFRHTRQSEGDVRNMLEEREMVEEVDDNESEMNEDVVATRIHFSDSDDISTSDDDNHEDYWDSDNDDGAGTSNT